MSKATRFTFVRNRKMQPVGCIAYIMDKALGQLSYEVSTHNPKDEYDRETARFVAEGRLNKHPRKISFNPFHVPKLDMLLNSVALDLIASDDEKIPNRLKRALKLRVAYVAKKNTAKVDLPKGFARLPAPVAADDSF